MNPVLVTILICILVTGGMYCYECLKAQRDWSTVKVHTFIADCGIILCSLIHYLNRD